MFKNAFINQMSIWCEGMILISWTRVKITFENLLFTFYYNCSKKSKFQCIVKYLVKIK